MKSNRLKTGTRFQWETKDKDNLRIAVVGCHNPWGAGERFFIHFNGMFIHTCRGGKSLEKRLTRLIAEWDMEPVTYDEENSPI